MIELQTQLTPIQAEARLRADALDAHSPPGKGDTAPREGSAVEAERPTTSSTALPSRGTCLQVRARMEHHAQAASPGEDEDDRVVVFLTGDDRGRGALLKRDILGEYNPMRTPEPLPRFLALDFADDAEILHFYQDFGPCMSSAKLTQGLSYGLG